jgi:tripartite-type tricarboxylate transporter receptor subunit TctC
MKIHSVSLAILASLALTAPLQAQQAYPAKPVRLITPVTPAGGMDDIARVVARHMAAGLGESVVVENRPGGGSSIGTAIVAKANPDGYTLLFTSNAITINPFLYKKLPYDATKDLVSPGLVTTMPLLIVSHPSVPVYNIPELISYAKANPDKLSYGSAGTGTVHHLAMELFKSATGVKIAHVPYKGTAPGFVDVLGGHIPLLVVTPTTILQPVQKGRLRALGSMEINRLADFKDIAAISETLPGFEIGIWHGVYAPAGTPAAILKRLTGVLQTMAVGAQFKDEMLAIGVVPKWVAPDDVPALMRTERDKWADAAKKAGIEPE